MENEENFLEFFFYFLLLYYGQHTIRSEMFLKRYTIPQRFYFIRDPEPLSFLITTYVCTNLAEYIVSLQCILESDLAEESKVHTTTVR